MQEIRSSTDVASTSSLHAAVEEEIAFFEALLSAAAHLAAAHWG